MSTIAVIKSGGKQYLVAKDDVITVEKIPNVKVDDEVKFSEVLLRADEAKASVGTPALSSQVVTAKVIEHGLGKKVTIMRFKSKSNYQKKTGHRQPYTKLLITSV